MPSLPIPQELLTKLYEIDDQKSLENLLLKKEFTGVWDKIQIVTQHRRKPKHFTFRARDDLLKKRIDYGSLKKGKEYGEVFYLVEITSWSQLDIENFKRKFQYCSGIVVLALDTFDDHSATTEHQQLNSNKKYNLTDYAFNNFIDGLDLKVILKYNIPSDQLKLKGKVDPKMVSFPLQTSLHFQNARITDSSKKFFAPKLNSVLLEESDNSVLSSLPFEELENLDILRGGNGAETIGEAKYQVTDSQFPKLLWANLRNIYKVDHLALPLIERLLLLTTNSPNGEYAKISNIEAPRLTELMIEFWDSIPSLENFQAPNLKSVKLSRVSLADQIDNQDVLNLEGASSLSVFKNVSHWVLFDSLDMVSKTEIPEHVKTLEIITTKQNGDKFLKSLKFPLLHTLILDRQTQSGKIPRFNAPMLSDLTITFPSDVIELDFSFIHDQVFSSLKKLEINNPSNEYLQEVQEAIFPNLEKLEINGVLFTDYDLKAISKWNFPNLKTIKYRIDILEEPLCEDPVINISFNAPKLETMDIRFYDNSAELDNRASAALEISNYPSLTRLEIAGISSLKLKNVENLTSLISSPGYNLDSIVADKLPNLVELEYEFSNSVNPSEIESITELNSFVRRTASLNSNYDDSSDGSSSDAEDAEDSGAIGIDSDDIEEEY